MQRKRSRKSKEDLAESIPNGLFAMEGDDSSTLQIFNQENPIPGRPSSFGSLMSKLNTYKSLSAITTSESLGPLVPWDFNESTPYPSSSTKFASCQNLVGVAYTLNIEGGLFLSIFWSKLSVLNFFKSPLNFSSSTFVSFVSALFASPGRWGVIELPSFGKSEFIIYKDGKIIQTQIWSKDILDDLNIKYVEKKYDEESIFEIDGIDNCMGILNSFYLEKLQSNPKLTCSHPFLNSIFVKPKCLVKMSANRDRKFMAISDLAVPIQIVHALAEDTLVCITTEPRSFGLFNGTTLPSNIVEIEQKKFSALTG